MGTPAAKHWVSVAGGELVTNGETAAFRWAAEADVRRLATEAYATRVIDALSHASIPVIRQLDGRHLL